MTVSERISDRILKMYKQINPRERERLMGYMEAMTEQ